MSWTFRIPLPPNGVNTATMPGAHGSRYKTSESRAWESGAKLLLGGWTPPKRTPLRVVVVLGFPRESLWRRDADKWGAVIADLVLGAHSDQWVAEYTARKIAGDGWATVTVEPLSNPE